MVVSPKYPICFGCQGKAIGNVDTFRVEDYVSYQDWRESEYSGAELLDDEISGPLADPNDDGVTNLSLFVLGLPATGNQNHKMKAPTLDHKVASTLVSLDVFLGLNGVEFILEESPNLDDWTVVTGATETSQEVAGRRVLNFDVPETVTSKSKIYYRVRFNQVSP